MTIASIIAGLIVLGMCVECNVPFRPKRKLAPVPVMQLTRWQRFLLSVHGCW